MRTPSLPPRSTTLNGVDVPVRVRNDAELIILLALLAAIGPLSIDAYLPAMPAIAADLRVASPVIEQSLSSYFVGLALGQVICGPLSDRLGRRPILFGGLVLYLLATVACVMVPGAHGLIAGRALQGLGASATPAVSRAVVRDLWSGNRAARAMSFIMMAMAFAPIVAPLLGGQILIYLGWRAIFWLMFFFGLLLVALVALRLPETHGPARRANVRLFDHFVAYRLVLSSARGWAYLLAGGLSYAVLFGYIIGSPSVYIEFFGVRPDIFGFYFGLNVIGLTLGNWFNSRFVMRWGYLRMLGMGILVTSVGTLALLLFAQSGAGGLTAVVLTLFIAVAPVGMSGANAIAGLLDRYPDNAGAASALFGVSQFGFGAVAGVLASAFHTGSAAGMAWTMLVMALGAMVAWLGLWWRSSRCPSLHHPVSSGDR